MHAHPPARAIITEQSFVVAPQLLGQPLASPSRRALAMLIDLLLLAILVNAGAFFFGLAAAYTLWRVSRRFAGEGRGPIGRAWLLSLRGAAALVLFIFAMSGWGTLTSHVDRLVHGKARAEQVSQRRRKQEAPAAQLAGAAVPEGAAFAPSPPARAALEGESLGAAADPLAALRELVGELEAENHELKARMKSEGEARGAFSFLAETADELGLGFGWAGLYFTAFLVLGRGQTPGKRLAGIRVVQLDGKALGWWASFERFGGYGASIFTGLLGFAQLLWDRNRQAMHDKICETVVVRV